jgi:hypothetical protein
LTAPLCAQTPSLPKEQKNGFSFNAIRGTGADPLTTTDAKLELNRENLLTEPASKPGKILAVYSMFYGKCGADTLGRRR